MMIRPLLAVAGALLVAGCSAGPSVPLPDDSPFVPPIAVTSAPAVTPTPVPVAGPLDAFLGSYAWTEPDGGKRHALSLTSVRDGAVVGQLATTGPAFLENVDVRGVPDGAGLVVAFVSYAVGPAGPLTHTDGADLFRLSDASPRPVTELITLDTTAGAPEGRYFTRS